jgi:hypothetical protein
MSASHMNDSMNWANIMQWKKEDVPLWGDKLKEKYNSLNYTCHAHMPEVEKGAYNFVSGIDWPISRVLKLIGTSMETGPWIAGGAPLKWYQTQSVGSGDIDIWFRNRIQFEQVFYTLTAYEKYFALVCKTENAVTLRFTIPTEDRSTDQPYPDYFDVQLISKKFFSSPEDIIDYFDFTICQVVTDGDQVMIGPRTHYDIKHKILRFNGDVNSTLAVKRFTKYLCRGYRPVDGMVAQMMSLPDLKLDFKDTDPYGF